jgi:Acyl-CoA dehydrogenase, C-terminal domain
VRFEVAPELRLFGQSVRAAVGDWEAPREPDLGTWLDDRDAGLDARLAEAGWSELWTAAPEAVVAGALELGRALAPICTVDEATLGAPLSVAGRIRHGVDAETSALPLPGWGLAPGRPSRMRQERTLDGSGTVRAEIAQGDPLADADARWTAWTAATLAYLAGLAAASLDATVEHARAREQFGRPLAALPAIQARLADASLNVDALELVAWNACAAAADAQWRTATLLWAGTACRDVTLSAHQIHGAVGFALETGLHRYYRRAKSVQAWAAAVTRECT